MDKTKKKTIKRWILWGSLAALVLVLAIMPLMAKNQEAEDGPTASILSGTVTTGSISTALHGGGTLEAGSAEDITIPSGVKITEFLVKNGDTVTEGTPLAAVDKVTVMTAITEIRESMEYLQGQMENVRKETVSSTVSATAGGRVKKVYGQAGDSVQEVMLEHGALAVLSLDGLMAVDIPADTDLVTGDTVLVTLTDGTEASGRVESNLIGALVVTLTDDGYAIGEKVTVAREDGTRIGSGELYVHSAWKATAFTGTISNVSAREERTVSSGATLFTLTDTEFTAQLESLASKHRDYEERMQELFRMYESGYITAPCDGLISGIDEDSAHLLAAEEEQRQVELLNADNTEPLWHIVLLSNVAADQCTRGEDCPLDHDSPDHLEGCIKACDRSAGCDAAVHYADCVKSCTHADNPEDCKATVHYPDCIRSCISAKTEGQCKSSKHYLTCIESCISSDGTVDCPASRHKADCIEACIHADTAGVCEATAHHYPDCIESCVLSNSASTPCSASKHKEGCFFADMTYKASAAKVSAVGSELVVFWDASGAEYTVERSGSGWVLAGGATLNTDLLIYGEGPTVPVSNPEQFSQGDIILVVTGYKGSEAVWSDVVLYQKGQQSGGLPDAGSGLGDLGSILGGMSGISGFGGMSGMQGFSGGSAGGEPELFDLEGDVLMTVTPQDTMTLTIDLDEQDISKVSVGQTAEVKVTALKNQTFEAEVTKVAVSGANNGGSSKFAVELTLDMSADLLAGMSATVSIPLYTKMDVLTIPVAALVEDGANTVVYTALDKKTGEPTSPVTVETGVSDGETAEVLSGLKSGDSYYYRYYDTLELSTEVKSSGFAFSR